MMKYYGMSYDETLYFIIISYSHGLELVALTCTGKSLDDTRLEPNQSDNTDVAQIKNIICA